MISKTAVHALRALVTLAALPNGAYAGASAIAKEIAAPQNYLGKLLQALSHTGLVTSQKGHGGGFRLGRDPREITLLEVVEPIDQVSRKARCPLGRLLCSDHTACPIHARWKVVVSTYMDFLRETTLADVVSGRVKV